jgi:DDE_Tnp_1-associated
MTYSTALPLTLPSLTSNRRQQLLQKQPLLSLYEVFATIPDPRSKHGLRYELAYLLICLVAALLCNCDSTLAVGEWCRDQRLLLIRLFGPRRFLCPSDSLYCKLLPRLNAEQLEWTLADWIRTSLCAQPEDPIALDGKTVRGAGTDEQPAPHLLSFRTHQSQETLLQVAVSEKTNEIPVAQALLPCLPLQGRVCTAAALTGCWATEVTCVSRLRMTPDGYLGNAGLRVTQRDTSLEAKNKPEHQAIRGKKRRGEDRSPVQRSHPACVFHLSVQ